MFPHPVHFAPQRRSSGRLLLLLLLLWAIAVGCTKTKDERNSNDPGDNGGKTRVRLQLNWLPDAQFGGYYAAQLAGDYAREGLAVKIIMGGPDAAVLPKLAMGRADFGIGNADQLLLARQQGADVVAVLAVMQDNPRCIMVHESSGIAELAQLENLTLAMGEGNAFAQFLKSHLTLNGVRIVSYAGNIAKFLIDDQFAQQGYVFSEPIVARRRGSDPRALMVSELGFNPYAGIVMVHRQTYAGRSEVVQKFVRATRRGWLRYLESPTAANQEIHRLNPEVDLDSLSAAVDVLRPLCQPTSKSTVDSASVPSFGTMTRARWQTLVEQLIELGLLKEPAPDIDDVFATQ